MAEEMTNIEIRDFLTVSGVEGTDHVVLSLTGGTSAKMAVGLFQSTLTQKITPSIRDGVWWIGEVDQKVLAEGLTPEFRKSDLGIEWKYTNQPASSWTLLVPISDILFKFDELTEDQRDLIRLKFSDLTDAEIAELQKPANDMIATLEATNASVADAETARVTAEEGRVEAETARVEEEKLRVEAETGRAASAKSFAEAEDARKENETQRVSSENARKDSESARVSSENTRAENEEGRISQEEARVEAEKKRVTAESSRVSAEEDRVDEFARLKAESEAATASAQDTADHPTYVGEDNYVYEWDKTAKTYNKTSVYVRGEAFSIKKVYASIDEMYADTATSFKEGDFCLINTGSVEDEETAQLFVRTAIGGWDFVVDMSGAVGFTGKTPQLTVGAVSVGSGKASAAVTLTPDGTDADGNPQYLINYVIPCLAYEDLTAGQIAELQRPASDMIAELRKTDDAVKQAEALRVSAEENRAEEFVRLKSESETATSNANTATEEANAARDAANKASQTALESAGKADKAAADADVATAGANVASGSAQTAATEANAASDAANAAAQAANDAAGNADISANNAEGAATAATEAASKADNAASRANTAADTANVSASNADAAASTANLSAITADEAAEDATLAARQARNLPKIQNGTWWLYDIEQGVYVDSGYAVSSDFQLTREGVESVLTGNVESHWHNRYVDKVEGKQLTTEDFTTVLKEKLEGLNNYDDAEISEAVEKLRKDFDTLVSGNTADAIESFNEVVAFLEGLKDTESLAGIIASIQAEIGKKADSTQLPTKVSQLENDVPYATSSELASGLSTKQGTIEDLASIRSGAALGATALQSVPEGYITETEIDGKLETKQDVNLYFSNVEASEWVEDTSFSGMKYRCDIPLEGVTEDMVPEVIFGFVEATSGDYAPLAETKDGVLSIWSATNKPIVIPTIIINK